ncbi:hypothetical protein [Vibrio barjaei]|uniref:hypothetical protein n=1 Tax=Vibrio barjaei TaxID=1676683 RepID=UPI0022838BE7|nr:hypothetical protein [Vibrio barjaei]MCY9873853.1 hypothetical protein [Vibrio barjaei]
MKKLAIILTCATILTGCKVEQQATTFTCTNAKAEPITGKAGLVDVFLSSEDGYPTIGLMANGTFYKHNECGASQYVEESGLKTFRFFQYGQLDGRNNQYLSGYASNLHQLDFDNNSTGEIITATFKGQSDGHTFEYVSKEPTLDGAARTKRKVWSSGGTLERATAVANNKPDHFLAFYDQYADTSEPGYSNMLTELESYFTRASYSDRSYVVIEKGSMGKLKLFDENNQEFICYYENIKGGTTPPDNEIPNCEGQTEVDADEKFIGAFVDMQPYFDALSQSPSFNTERRRYCRDMNRFGYVCDSDGLQ